MIIDVAEQKPHFTWSPLALQRKAPAAARSPNTSPMTRLITEPAVRKPATPPPAIRAAYV